MPSPAIVLLSAIAALCVGLWIYAVMRWPEDYDDFIVGWTTLNGSGKARDFFAVSTFAVSVLAFLVLGSAAHVFCARRLSRAHELDTTIWYALLPAALVFGQVLVAGPIVLPTLVLSVFAGVAAVAFAVMAAWRTRFSTHVEDDVAPWSAIRLSVVLPLLALVLPFAANVAASRLADLSVSNVPLRVGAALALGTFAMLVLLWLRSDERLARWLRGIVLAAQAPLVAFYLVMLPPRLVSPEGPAPQPEAGLLLYLVIGAIIIAALLDLVRRARWSGRALSPLALGGLVIVMAVPQSFIPFLPTDDYHFGEYLYPWWALATFGQIPYVDFTPAHGLANYLAGAASALFFDGSAATYLASSTIVYGLLVLAAFVCLTPVMGIGLAWLPVFFLTIVTPISWIVVATVFGALTVRWLFDRPLLWVVSWIVLGTGAVLLAPAQGAALVMGTIPAGLLVLFSAQMSRPLRVVATLGGLGVCLLVIALFVPLLPMVIGALGYLVENGGINTVAYGIPWHGTATSPGYEMLRMAWIAVPLIAIGVAIWRPAVLRDPAGLLAVGVAVLLPVVVFGYVMGRIDPGPSRMGPAVVWLGLLALPVLLRTIRSRLAVPVALIAVVAAAALYPRALKVEPLVAAARPELSIPPLIDAGASSLADVGHVVADTAHMERITAIKTRLDTLLADDETYLDMTGHGAHYVYAGRPSPVPVIAPYNMAHPDQQARAVERLKTSVPPVALLAADNLNFEARTAALRAHRLYRWAVQTYRPIAYDGLIYGITPERWAALDLDDGRGTETMRVAAADHSDVNWTKGISTDARTVFFDSSALADALRPGDPLTFAASGPRTVIEIDGRNVTVDGPLDPKADGYPNPIGVPDQVLSVLFSQRDLILLDRAFRIADLGVLPASWGRSTDRLDARMEEVLALDLATATLTDLEVDAQGWWTPSGPDPHAVIDLPDTPGASAGLLVAEFTCSGGDGSEPSLQLFWTSERDPQFSEVASVSFRASNGALIAPLDSQPRWLAAKRISRLRIDLANRTACGRFRLTRPYLAQRSGL